MDPKARLVTVLEQACTWKDAHLPGPLAGFRGCWLAMLSDRLDQRWGTGVWKAPERADEPYRTHWGTATRCCIHCARRIHVDEYGLWHHTEDDSVICGGGFPLQVATPPEERDRIRVHHDRLSDRWYVQVRDAERSGTVEIADGITVDVDAEGRMRGLMVVHHPDVLSPAHRGALVARFPDDGPAALDRLDAAGRRRLPF